MESRRQAGRKTAEESLATLVVSSYHLSRKFLPLMSQDSLTAQQLPSLLYEGKAVILAFSVPISSNDRLGIKKCPAPNILTINALGWCAGHFENSSDYSLPIKTATNGHCPPLCGGSVQTVAATFCLPLPIPVVRALTERRLLFASMFLWRSYFWWQRTF